MRVASARERPTRQPLRCWAALLVLLIAAVAGADEKADSCVACHADYPEELGAPVEGMKSDVHTAHGISCADCHGGDPNDPDMTSMDPEKGFRGVPTREQIPDFCARCHSDPAYMRRFNPSIETDQRERYRTSVHGIRLADGDEKVATCVSCHGVHGIRAGRQADSPVYPANIPTTCGTCHSNAVYMAGYEIKTDQEERYRRSVHGHLLLEQRDLSAPTCTTCHGNHGASPPGLTSIAQVCGQCHVTNAELFTASPHKEAFDRLGLAECAACHEHHDVQRTNDEQIGVHGQGQCARCHAAGSAGYAAAEQMQETVHGLLQAMNDADALLARAEKAGMEVSDARYEFQNVKTDLIRTRTGVHRFSPEYLTELASPGMALAAKTDAIAVAALAEARARRLHLLFPLAIIGLTMVLLVWKLRRLERGSGSGERE